PVIYDPAQIDFSRPGKHHYQVAFHLDSTWGYSLVPLTVINGQRPGNAPAVAAFGGTHGNEYEGPVAIKRLAQDLDPADIAGRVILIPQLSESACVAGTRVSPLDGVNMNRAFPGNPRGTVSYRIAHFVKTRIFPQVRVVLDIHAGGREAVFPICTSFHPIPDPAQRTEIAAVARLFDTPFIFIYTKQMASGLLTDEAEAEGKIAIGGEFGFGEATSVRGTRHAYEGIKNVLRHYGLLAGEVVKIDPDRPTPPRLVQAANLEDYIPCPTSGIWEPAVEVGADVQEGDLMGRLHDFSDHSSLAREIRAHRSGVVIALYFAAVCQKGSTLYVIGQDAQL
ncbi:MAG: succinylglutamate desuccinylase/aspartoacylase family protein, partial [Acidobacteria bacterium]|nr:succinylglutamate desuccinylase/aspartoacylase family protein [Acidobacteriota bacterium]